MILKKLFLFSILILFSYADAQVMLTQNEQDYLKEKKEISICFSPKSLDYGLKNNWTIVDMKNEWKVIYPFELTK